MAVKVSTLPRGGFYLRATCSRDGIRPVSPRDLSEPLGLLGCLQNRKEQTRSPSSGLRTEF